MADRPQGKPQRGSGLPLSIPGIDLNETLFHRKNSMQNGQLTMVNYQSLNSAIRNAQLTDFFDFGDDLFGLEVPQADGT